ncbi:uncharacterized protein LOC131937684 [Physella acuta]|uniref:uncharacterized protein LOC131937684 n=1 Tax=Physella acuta TaxID=109671 RepID=UPI0027DE8AC2|nr:uncharacterized protein LOC131937684 [Physella acuta]
MTPLVIFVLLSCLNLAEARVGAPCTTVAQCGRGECCQVLSDVMIASRKRAAVFRPVTVANRTGTCQRYKREGDRCNSFDAMNGYCSCEPGTSCVSYQLPILTARLAPSAPLPTARLARSAPAPMPGYRWASTCNRTVA